MGNLIYAARPLLNDLAASLFFAALLVAGTDPTVATFAAMAFGVAHVALWLALKKPVAPLQWASLGLVLVLGAAGLVMHDPRFVMAKPSAIYLIIAVVMMRRGWMLRYLPPVAAGHGEGLMIGFGYAWAGLMAANAAANVVVAVWFAPYWPIYKAIVPISSNLALFAVQYATIRFVVRRRIIAQAAQAQPQAA